MKDVPRYTSPRRGEGGPHAKRGRVRAADYTPYSSGRSVACTAAKTDSISLATSAFQNLMTKKPQASNSAVRLASYSAALACCPPSSSITNFASMQTKSAMYPPMGYCLRNLHPSSCRLRNLDQRRASAWVWLRRKFRENSLTGISVFITNVTPHLPAPGAGPFLSPPGRGEANRIVTWHR